MPASLDLDLLEDAAWISVVALSLSRMRPTFLPPIPLLSDARQINVRTYVRHRGVPGLWFLSLDATNSLAVWAARLAYELPYHSAHIVISEQSGKSFLHAVRSGRGSRASFDAAWRNGGQRESIQPGTLDSFLLDRYLLYGGRRGLLSARIHHRPWPLRHAALAQVESTILEANGLPTPKMPPLLHAQMHPFDVELWAPSRLGDAS